MKKMPVEITSLAMRFCKFDGWTEEILNSYLISGNLVLRGFGDNESEAKYYILEVNSRLDVKRMIEDGIVGELDGRDRWSELKGKTDLEVLMDRNW
jgi:hypothetical protein